jgi:hypothetical protein
MEMKRLFFFGADDLDGGELSGSSSIAASVWAKSPRLPSFYRYAIVRIEIIKKGNI